MIFEKIRPGLVLGIYLLVLVGCSDPSYEEYIAQAEQHLAEGDYHTATIELKNALTGEKAGNTSQARWLLGKAHLETGDPSSAEKELELALREGWNPNDVVPALASARLTLGKYEAMGELSAAELEPRSLARLLASQALAELAQGNPWEAEGLIAIAREAQPDEIEVKIADSQLQATMGNLTEALVIIEEVLVAAPENGRAWSVKGDLLGYQRNFPEAAAAYDSSIEQQQNSFEDRGKRALINLQLGELAAAQADADWLLKAAPRHPMGNYVQGVLDFHNGSYASAIAALTLAEPLSQRYPMVLFYLSAAHLTEGNLEAALDYARRLVSLRPDYVPARKLLASVYLHGRQVEEVQEVLGPVLDRYPEDVTALNMLANALLLDGQTDEALDLLGRVEQLEPDSAKARFRLGAGLMLVGQNDQALRHLESTLELDPKYQQADILLILNLMQRQEYEGAIEAALEYRQRYPESAAAHGLLGRVYRANDQVAEATEAFEKALVLEPGDPAANHALAQMALDNDNVAAARQRYQDIIKERPDYLPASLQLALLDAMEGDETALVARLESAMQAHPGAVTPRLMLGRYYIWKGEPGRIPPLFADLTDLQRQSPQVLHLLALSQLSEEQYGEAVYTLEQLMVREPEIPLTHHLLATAAAASGDFDKAAQEWRQALELEENYFPSLVELARLASANGEMDEFEQHLQRLVELAPDAPDVLRLRAAAAQHAGESAQAIELARQAFDAAPGTDVMLELAGYEFVSGNSGQALGIIEQWVSDHPKDVEARLALASMVKHSGDIDKAIMQYSEAVKLDPENVAALNNLAWHLRITQPQQALEYSRRAAKIEPDRSDVLDTLAVIEHLKGDNKQALRNIQRALTASPNSPAMLYHQAMIEAALGDKASARKSLEKLLDKGEEFSERGDAEALLASLQ